MNYTNFHREVVMRYSVDLKGWPLAKFANPTDLGNSLPLLLELREALSSGHCHFVRLTHDELSAKIGAYQNHVASGEVIPSTRKKRNDAGKPRKMLKTPETIDSDGDTNSNNGNDSDSSSSSASSSSSSEEEIAPPPVRKSARTTKASARTGIPQPLTASITLANITNKRKHASTQLSDTENVAPKKAMRGRPRKSM
jgi:hypothetical protein